MQVLIQKGENSNKKEEKKSNSNSLCRNRVLCVPTNVQANCKGTLSRQYFLCRNTKVLILTDELLKNLTSQLRQRKFMLRQGFSEGCQHQKEFIAAKKLLSLQMKQAECRTSVAKKDLLSRY